jgi:hypothetical protein
MYTTPGGPCSCGVWITPAFQCTRSKLDVKPAVDIPVVDNTPATAGASLIQPLSVLQFVESNGQQEVGEIGTTLGNVTTQL